MKSTLKEKAVILRKQGRSYSEILSEVPVAKSTLSAWLHSVSLSKTQKQRLTEKKMAAISRGWETKRRQRIEKTETLKTNARQEIKSISKEDLWLMGIMLYWAEGAKSKKYNVSEGIIFSNTDKLMIKFFLKWLTSCLKIPKEMISFDIYIHDTHKQNSLRVAEYWSSVTGFEISKFGKIYYKRHKLDTNRRNIGDSYYGLLRVRVKKSTDLNRKITGWIEGICLRCGVV